jgi:hypothetical protein
MGDILPAQLDSGNLSNWVLFVTKGFSLDRKIGYH